MLWGADASPWQVEPFTQGRAGGAAARAELELPCCEPLPARELALLRSAGVGNAGKHHSIQKSRRISLSIGWSLQASRDSAGGCRTRPGPAQLLAPTSSASAALRLGAMSPGKCISPSARGIGAGRSGAALLCSTPLRAWSRAGALPLGPKHPRVFNMSLLLPRV